MATKAPYKQRAQRLLSTHRRQTLKKSKSAIKQSLHTFSK